MGVLAVSCLLAAILGFAAQRASICNVKAVAELIGSGRACMLGCIVKSILWVLVVTVPYLMLVPAASARLGGWQLSAMPLLGGLIFGLGAAINGGCAFSTLARLAEGQLAMLGTLGGFVLGAIGFLRLMHAGWVAAPVPSPSMVGVLIMGGALLLPALATWALYELVRLWRSRSPGAAIERLLAAPQYRLSSAAMLIGLANGGLYLIHGAWGYTGTLQQVSEAALFGRNFPLSERWLLFAALLAGMVLSTWQRRSLRVDWRPRSAWTRNCTGGVLMGFGAALVPGGNDAIVLYGIPSLSPHAIPSYLAMILGVAVALVAMRVCLGVNTKVECRGDVCVTGAPIWPADTTGGVRAAS